MTPPITGRDALLPAPPPTAAASDAPLPLVPLQAGMLLHAVRAPGSGVDIEQIVLRTRERLRAADLHAAWRAVVFAEPMLRTAFTWTADGRPVQQAAPDVTLDWTVESWRDVAPADVAPRLAAWLAADRRRPLPLDQAPVMRWTLLQEAGGDDILIWTFHHALLDGRSFPLVLDDVFARYDHAAAPRAVEPRGAFGDVVRALAATDWSAADRFWHATLAGVTSPTRLALAAPAPAAPPATRVHDEIARRLEAAETAALESFAAAQGVTMHTLVQAAWALLLHHYSHEHDVMFGVTRAGRHLPVPGVERMLGLLINTLPLRVAIDRAQPLEVFLADVRRAWRAQRPWAHTPLTRVQAASAVPAGQPLFDTLVVYEHRAIDEVMRSRGGAWASRRVAYHGQTNIGVTLTAYGGERLSLHLGFYHDRLEPGVAARMLAGLRTLLLAMPLAAALPIGRLPLHTADERRALLAHGNDTDVDYGPAGLLQHTFEAAAARTPDAVAVVAGEGTLTYAALDRRANQLAHHLRGLGLQPRERVAVCLERSLDMVVTLLAVLKAGAAYVPIDPDYPADRVAFMLADAGATVVVTHLEVAARLHTDAIVLALDEAGEALDERPATPPVASIGPDDPAYMIYTSGSTGRPKGAINTHRGIVNRLRWMQAFYQLTPADAVLQKTPFSFDVSVWEFFWPLGEGARLVVAAPDSHRDPDALVAAVTTHQVTVLHFVPSMLRVFLQARHVATCTSVREIICSGEALAPDLVDACHRVLPATLRNLYGPTEAAVDVTHWTCPREAPTTRVPIGYAAPNTRCYVLDDALEPVPAGVSGELYLGGVQVGTGYHGRPDLTAARFLSDPFAAVPDARLYRTGDICRRLPDGALEYLGRTDHQVKVRGFRIELGEIEAALAAQPGVTDAVVVARQDVPGDPQLVAYVTGPAAVDSLRRALAAALPDYMVPQHIVALAALPLSPNGKLDRARLPRPAAGGGEAARRVAPATDLERRIAAIWCEVLGVDAVGVTVSFFEAGGHSLSLMQVHRRLCDALGLDVPIVMLFRLPTVRALAAELARATDAPLAVAAAAPADRAARQRDHAARMRAARGTAR